MFYYCFNFILCFEADSNRSLHWVLLILGRILVTLQGILDQVGSNFLCHWTILLQENLSTLRLLLQLDESFLSLRHSMGAILNYKNTDHKVLQTLFIFRLLKSDCGCYSNFWILKMHCAKINACHWTQLLFIISQLPQIYI